MGDMNFRIRDFTREEVISKVQGEYIQEFNVDILVNWFYLRFPRTIGY